MYKGRPYCMPCDKWNRVADNIAAVAAHLKAMRGQERWGVGTIEQAFEGYLALPEHTGQAQRDWWVVLGVAPDAPKDVVSAAYRKAARMAHPDNGGSHDRMAEINAAYAAAKTTRGGQ